MLIHNKDDIEFVTEFPWLLGHPVCLFKLSSLEDVKPTWLEKMSVPAHLMKYFPPGTNNCLV